MTIGTLVKKDDYYSGVNKNVCNIEHASKRTMRKCDKRGVEKIG